MKRTEFIRLLQKTLVSVAVLTLCIVMCATAEDNPQRDFGFGAMEIYKLDNGTHLLRVEDMDVDGLDDILFLNNGKSRLEILFRKEKGVSEDPGLLDDQFDNRGMMVDQRVSLYRIVDLNGDKKPDILTMGMPLGLHIRWQRADREFSAPKHLFLSKMQDVMSVQTGDINEDGLDDIIVSRRRGAEILWNDDKQTFQNSKRIPYAGDGCYWIELVDANEDKHLDILMYYNNKDIPLKVRLGDGKGQFGMAHILRIPRMQSITLVKPRYDDQLMLAGVLSNRLGARLYEFENSTQPVMLEAQEFTPQRLSIPSKGKMRTLPWVNADFNSDGYDDILVSSPALSQLNLYKGSAEGIESTASKYDTLTEVSGLKLLEDGDILVVSAKEKAVGVHRKKSMDTFPELLDVKGTLITATAITGTSSIYLLRRDEDQIFMDHYEDVELKESWPLELENDPSAMQVFSMGKSLVGLLLYIDYNRPEMILLGVNGIEKVQASRFRALSQNLKPSQVLEPEPGSGLTLVVASGSTVRRYEWKSGAYQIRRQYNPMNEHADAVLACMYQSKKEEGLMVYDSNSKDILWYSGEAKSEPKKIHIADGAGNFSGIAQLKSKDGSLFMLVGDQDIALLVDNGEILALKECGEYMSESEKPSLRLARVIEIGKPARPAIAVVDAANRTVEIISKQSQGIKTELVFPVFLKSDMVGPTQSRTTEPHDISSGDINGDGQSDMVLLIHDNLLIYPGE